MLKEKRQVLLVIDDADVCKRVKESIHDRFGFEVEIVMDGKSALAMLEESPWQYDVTVIFEEIDKKLDKLELLREIKRKYSEIEVIFIVNSEKEDKADEWREGAFNCFFRPINYEGIAYGVRLAREQSQFRRERKMLEKLQELSIAINSATELQEIQSLACQAAVEIFGVDHSGLVLFEKDLSKGIVIAEYPDRKFIGEVIQVKKILAEEQLVFNQKIINVPDLSDNDELGEVRKKLWELKVHSVLIVPVMLDEKVIASISLDMITRNRVFYSDEIELCMKLASQVAVAIGKARYLKELSVLNELSQDISASIALDIEEIFELVRKHASELIDVKNFFIALWDENKKQYSLPCHIDEKDDKTSFPPEKQGKSLTDYVRRTQRPIYADVMKIRELNEKGEIDIVGTLSKIWLGAPIISRKKVHGVMVVQNYDNEDAYDEHDLTVLQTIASQAAIAIDNAQLIKDAKRRICDLEIVNKSSRIISTKLNPEALLQTMVTQIAEDLKCTHCTIFLKEEKNGEVELVPQKTHGVDSKRIMARTFKPGEGLAGWVFQNGESLVLGDANSDNRFLPARKRKNLPHSMLVVPVKVGNRTIGVICAEQDKTDWFSECDRQLVDTLTLHVGIAIERALGLNLLQEISLQLISSEDEEKILQRILTGAIELTNTTSGVIHLVSDDSKFVFKSYTHPTNFAYPPPRIDKGDGYMRLVLDTGKMIIAPDLSKDDRVNPILLKFMKSMIAVPLRIEGKVVGVLFLHDKESHNFSETECSLLEILASQAAIAIYNSRLYQESQRQLKEIETLYEISEEIAAKSVNIKSVLDTILIKALQLSNADSAQIALKDESENRVKLVSTHGLPVLKGVVLERGEGISSKVFVIGESLHTGDYHKHPDRAKIFDEPKFRKLFNSLAVVPLKWEGEVVGAITLTSIKFNNFTKNDVRLLERFSGTAAIAIAIARGISFRKTLLDNSPDAIVAVDRKGIIKEFNKAAEEILGYSRDEILNNSVVEVWGGEENARQIKRRMYKSENKRVRRIETFVKSKDSVRIPVLFSGSLLFAEGYDEKNEEIGSIGQIEDQRFVSLEGRVRHFFDVIEEINRNNELHELIASVLVSSVEFFKAEIGGIMLHDNGYLKFADSYGFPQNFDYEIKIKIGEGLIGKTAQGDTPFVISEFTETDPYIPFSSEGESALILPFKIEDRLIGVLYLESNQKNYFKALDELLKILSAEASIAINRAQLQEEKEETTEALFTTAKSVAAGQLATGFVHEVKNALNTIAMTVGNIGKRIQKEPGIKSKQEYIDNINTIETEIWRSYELSKRLQRFGQRMDPKKTEIYLNDVVKNTLELLDSTIKKQKMKCELKLDPALDKHQIIKGKKFIGNPVYMDKGQIEQVIINLVLNAIEASNRRGRLLVETKISEFLAEIKITDYGKGIKTEDFPEIFKPFFTTKEDGVGLGLYISKLIVEETHQGRIVISTKPDKGTVFSIQLPRKLKS